LLTYGCQNENIIFIRIETGYSNLADVLTTYEAYDQQNRFACTYLDNFPSQLYCYGPEPTEVSPVKVCLTIGGTQRCQTFTLPDFLPCVGSEPEEPQQPSDPCNQYNNPGDCKDHNCNWDPDQNVCESNI